MCPIPIGVPLTLDLSVLVIFTGCLDQTFWEMMQLFVATIKFAKAVGSLGKSHLRSTFQLEEAVQSASLQGESFSRIHGFYTNITLCLFWENN